MGAPIFPLIAKVRDVHFFVTTHHLFLVTQACDSVDKMSSIPSVTIDDIKIVLSDFDYEDFFQVFLDSAVKADNTGATAEGIFAMQMRDLEGNLRNMTDDGKLHRLRAVEVMRSLNELAVKRIKNQAIREWPYSYRRDIS